MECACIDASDYADGIALMITTKIRKARKEHKCTECHDKINPGESYEHSKYLWEGGWAEDKTCPACLELRTEYFCSWISGQIWEDLKQIEIALPDFESLSTAAQIKYIDMTC